MRAIDNVALGVAALLAALVAIAPQADAAQPHSDQALADALSKADHELFDEGFNRCDFGVLERVVHADLQFFHDENGMQDRAAFFKAFRESICSNPSRKPIRRRVEGSLVVYPLRNAGELYGALQTGRHEFFVVEPGKEPRLTSTGRFIHTWLRVGEQWKLYRVVSYDHKQPDR